MEEDVRAGLVFPSEGFDGEARCVFQIVDFESVPVQFGFLSTPLVEENVLGLVVRVRFRSGPAFFQLYLELVRVIWSREANMNRGRDFENLK